MVPSGPSDIDDWHDQVTEDALEPDLPIIDAHHHLWDSMPTVQTARVERLYGKRNHFTKDFWAADLQQTGGHRVIKTVYVEAGQKYDLKLSPEMASLGETRFMQAVGNATKNDATHVCAAIVGHVNLMLGEDVEAILWEHMRSANFRGVRHSCAGYWDGAGQPSEAIPQRKEAVPHLYKQRKFQEAFGFLSRFGLTFDAWCYHTQLDEVLDLARAFPETTIILDHIGGPLGIGPFAGKRAEVFSAEWKPAIARLAACPNVNVKLGGIMPLNGFGFELASRPPTSQELADELAPWHLFCIEQFGAHRCMFESNFPVDRSSVSYGVLWNAFKLISAGFSREARLALFAGTAARVYSLDVDVASLALSTASRL